MSENETEIDQPIKIKDIVEKILDLNKQNQPGKGLKILTTNQRLSRLPLTLVQARKNSQKLNK